MKKQALFDLASMPKMILIITLVVMLGLLFGAVSYLLKTPKTNLLITNPIVETQCEIDSDCLLVYVSDYDYTCQPCDRSLKEYQCLTISEIKKLKNKGRQKDESMLCSPCPPEFDKYTCKCANGECKKVKEDLVEEVSITTDKMEYEQGEVVEIIIKNDLDGELFFRLSIESFDNSNWNKIVKDIRCDCNLQNCPIPQLPIKANSEGIKFWNQKKGLCDELPLGQKLRIEMMCGEGANYIIYSNEFTIKEKSALDARCEEKVKIIGNCPAYFEEGRYYEFNSEAGKCIEKFIKGSGCNIKTPFKTLEECQEVCEESDMSKVGSYLAFLMSENELQKQYSVDIEFSSEFSDEKLMEIENDYDLTFSRLPNGSIAHTARFYGAKISGYAINQLSKRLDVIRIESLEKPVSN